MLPKRTNLVTLPRTTRLTTISNDTLLVSDGLEVGADNSIIIIVGKAEQEIGEAVTAKRALVEEERTKLAVVTHPQNVLVPDRPQIGPEFHGVAAEDQTHVIGVLPAPSLKEPSRPRPMLENPVPSEMTRP
jgi:hypothetical protein